MKTNSLVFVLVLAFSVFPFAARAAEPTFKAGFAERDITPQLGMEAPGNYMKQYHRTKHDACKVRASVWDDGTNRVAIVGVDVLGLRRPSVEMVRRGVTEKTGIPSTSVLIGASHTHSGGPSCMVLPGEYDHADDFVKKLAYEKSSCASAEYLALVEKAIIEAVSEANEKRAAAIGGAGYGMAEGIAFNRRFHMRSGGTMTHPGQGNPDILESAGPVDPQVGVLAAWSKEGKPLGCVVNFASHATTGPGGISADYIYYVERTVKATYGDEVGVVFLAGMAGDVTQVDARHPNQVKQFGEDSARLVGGTVGAGAVQAMTKMNRGPLTPVAAVAKNITFKRRVPKPEKVAKCLELAHREPAPGKEEWTDWVFAKETVMLDALVKQSPTVEAEVQVMQVGPAVFCTVPAEYFCQYGLDIKKGSKFPYTFPVSLANGCVGYVPTEEALGPKGGGYETRLTSYSNLEPTAGTTMAKSLVEMTNALSPGAEPKPVPLPPFTGKPWGYGSVPPELE